jgi:type I restriction-modification system DNA methylase subunit
MLFHKKLLKNAMTQYKFPVGEVFEQHKNIIKNWQTSLRNSDLEKTKETAIQGLFLQKFFCDILGYVSQVDGETEYHLIQHPKSEIDAKEADGALGIFNPHEKIYRAVIELKDAKTPLDKKQSARKDYGSPVEQVFSYLSKFDQCDWAILSNFKELRLYHKSRGQGFYEKFEILELHQPEEFKRFYFLLCRHNLMCKHRTSLLDKLVADTSKQQEDISKVFYKQFNSLRFELFQHLLAHNSLLDKTCLLEKTQKLLDRMIFVFFCQDSYNLLPARIAQEIYRLGVRSRERSDLRIWREFKHFFQDIDEGRYDLEPPINAYNGGLFAYDEVLNNLVIKDEIWKGIIKLAEYDFDSDLNVNILGHIFEQSLSDLEKLKSELSGEHISVVNGKRKKEGIFYTPEYITRYIVEQTVGEYLKQYPEKLDTIKILDPACGSGAFLNQAHSFLREQHKVRWEEKIAQAEHNDILNLNIFEHSNLVEIDKSILLNNLFGVDLNAESVELTKLALWLKTAKPSERLQNLEKNIKCGNSLIDDASIAGTKAFVWTNEFSDIFEQEGQKGFDVVVGNPPYVFAREKISAEEKFFYGEHYFSANYQVNTFVLFIEKALTLLKNGGYLGFIVPNSLLKISSVSKLREYILKNAAVKEIVNLYGYSFENVHVETVIFVLKKGEKTQKVNVLDVEKEQDIFSNHYKIVNAEKWYASGNFDFDIFVSDAEKHILTTLLSNSVLLEHSFDVKAGLQAYETGKGNPIQTATDVTERIYDFSEKIDNTTYPYLDGNDIARYIVFGNNTWLKYGDNLAAPRTFNIFSCPRILIREITAKYPKTLHSVYQEDIYLNNRSIINVLSKNEDKNALKFLLAVLNSKSISFYFEKTNPKANRSMFPKLILQDLRKFPIPKASQTEQQSLAQKAEKMLDLTKNLYESATHTLEFIQVKYHLSKISKKMEKFWQLGINPFFDELKKQKVKLSLTQEEELMQWYKQKQAGLLELEKQITHLDHQIDTEVYQLYALTTEEISVIESSMPAIPSSNKTEVK